MGIIYRLALVLAIIGAINWGLIGLFQFDLVATLFGGQETFLSRTVYSLVGLSGLLCIPLLFRAFEEEDAQTVNNRETNSYTNMNYQTEFGEENDFTEEQRKRALELYSNDDDRNNNNTTNS
ncbi:hypothetical protein SAMN05880501_10498 [Ureibacillus xyleni]|uniref:DUF378 domain-containing protein n=1 Tax=Ureibacillus xyleni TaxID=614648 RepID=A0A285SD38_9BACL|nr:DUF378 domain-containing protein [Ureibacillus xyleni]SOC05702.1 hypothetical protein SAMN05880501_10498 [Ureibacillus xyleni]